MIAPLLLLGAGCGSSTGGEPRAIPADQVPYRLLEDSPSIDGPAGERERPRVEDARIYWVDPDDTLLPVGREGRCAQPAAALAERLLAELVEGPTPDDRASGLGTALAPGSALRLDDLRAGTATVSLDPSAQSSSAERLPVAIGQVVLTLGSVPGVVRVSIAHDGEPLQVPLPGGRLTSSPVTTADYEELVPPRDRLPDRRSGEVAGPCAS